MHKFNSQTGLIACKPLIRSNSSIRINPPIRIVCINRNINNDVCSVITCYHLFHIIRQFDEAICVRCATCVLNCNFYISRTFTRLCKSRNIIYCRCAFKLQSYNVILFLGFLHLDNKSNRCGTSFRNCTDSFPVIAFRSIVCNIIRMRIVSYSIIVL